MKMITNEEKILAYLQNRMTLGEKTLRAMTLDQKKQPLAKRAVWLVIDKYIRDFQAGKTDPRWVAIPGLRGVGKTTLVAQLYSSIRCDDNHKIYITLDDAMRVLGVSLSQILDCYEKMLGTKFENLERKVYLFLDEVQYDDSWALTLKNLYDKTKNVFIICTGSSALSLQTNPDSSRRINFTRIYPLTFTEYQMVKYKKFPARGVGNQIRTAIFGSKTAAELYGKLNALEKLVDNYWKDVRKNDLEEYLKYGTLPSSLALGSEPLIYPNINQTLNSVLNRDVPQLNAFDKQTIEKLSQILYTVASNDSTSFRKISEAVNLDYKTVVSVFEALEKTELLIRVYPAGSHESQVKKPSKYLFSSPAFRAMYYNLVGSTVEFRDYRGKLFEDVVGMYLFRIFRNVSEASLTYDSDAGGADFVLRPGLDPNDCIVLEASLGQKGSRQVITTLGRVKARYGIVVSTSPLRLDDTKQCISVPLKFFLLI